MGLEEAPDPVSQPAIVGEDRVEGPAAGRGALPDLPNEAVVEELLVLGLAAVDGEGVVLGHAGVEEVLQGRVVLPVESLRDGGGGGGGMDRSPWACPWTWP